MNASENGIRTAQPSAKWIKREAKIVGEKLPHFQHMHASVDNMLSIRCNGFAAQELKVIKSSLSVHCFFFYHYFCSSYSSLALAEPIQIHF